MTTETRPSLRGVALPAEHGGWSLTLEPVLLGLIVAPSFAGVALGLAALLAFLTRTPAKLAMVDRLRRRRLERTGLAQRVAAAYAAGIVVLVAVAAITAERSFWHPLAWAAPLIAIEFWFDVRSRGRRLLPELAGTIGVGSVAAAIVLAGGGVPRSAWAAWWVVGARAVAAIPFVRVQLRRAKTQSHRVTDSDLAQVCAGTAVAMGFVTGFIPVAGLVAVAVMATFHVWATRVTPPGTPTLGAQQVVIGLGIVVATGLGLVAP